MLSIGTIRRKFCLFDDKKKSLVHNNISSEVYFTERMKKKNQKTDIGNFISNESVHVHQCTWSSPFRQIYNPFSDKMGLNSLPNDKNVIPVQTESGCRRQFLSGSNGAFLL